MAAALWITFVAGDPGEVLAVRLARFAVYFAFAGVLIVLSFIDLATMRLPDVITLPAIPIFFVSGFATHHVPWLHRLIGAAAGYLFLRHHRRLLLLRAQARGPGPRRRQAARADRRAARLAVAAVRAVVGRLRRSR